MSTKSLNPAPGDALGKMKTTWGATQAASEENSKRDSDSLAAIVKRTIVFTALVGFLPMNWATWLIQRLHLEAA